MTAPQSSPSPLALMALVSGLVGLLMSLLGCVFWPFLCLGTVFCLLGLVLGFVEYGKVRSGTSDAANSGMALAGVGLGGGGCLFQAAMGLCGAGVFALYFVLIVFVAIAGG